MNLNFFYPKKTDPGTKIKGGFQSTDKSMWFFAFLNREQKEAVSLLQVGTFLEYFDLMLYVHMAVILNDLFFPKTDPHTASLMAAFAFCSTFVFRPIGALIFGWMGDHIGRKSTLIATTILMSLSCIVMANLPTYAQIGITATWLVTLCRMAQGMSSMGEIIGAEIYIAETVGRPASYPAVASLGVASALGAMVAVGVAALVTSFGINWRLAFWIGASVAIVGAMARTRLRETPEFIKIEKERLKRRVTEENRQENQKAGARHQETWKEPIAHKTLLAYFLIFCGNPLSFYLTFIYFNQTLKDQFGYISEAVVTHNFFLTVIMLVASVFWTFLSSRIHPLRILKTRGTVVLFLMAAMPFLIMVITSPIQLFVMQTFIVVLTLGSLPADAVFIYHLPAYSRFTYASFLYAIARALMYIVTSFGLVYLVDCFGVFGLWFITLPITTAFLYGVRIFEGLERERKCYPNLYFASVNEG
ncbi:MAG: transporter [Alphaproteobacteria bacterium]|jgi:MFS family permease|nr:transporter [Alphaproteobacteria bacterium]